MPSNDPRQTAADHASPGSHEMPKLWGMHTVLGITAALVLLGYMVTKIDLAQVWQDILACNKWYAFLGFLAHYATYPIRGMRWKRSLGHMPVQGSTGKFGLVVFFYNAVDNVVPGKIGDLYAAHLARINFRVRRSTALGSLFFLRLIDAWIVSIVVYLAEQGRTEIGALIANTVEGWDADDTADRIELQVGRDPGPGSTHPGTRRRDAHHRCHVERAGAVWRPVVTELGSTNG